ncbi:MAG: permease component of ribose/xylose/arabinose/galactoside ABC-type transporter [Phycisphaerales bacterium]|nr:permease component of ribose/xylose/arabinose/galactoside ABC-type transporter [Phycisphaerales bacterium]
MSTAPHAAPPLSPAAAADPAGPPRFRLAPAQLVLAAVLLAEVVMFGLLGENFLSAANLLTVLRQNAELGLVALALTPVILTGGIDLSVGSLMGLSAVLFGALWRAGLPPIAAGALVLVASTACGGLNALLVTRGRIPPLIVTLGTFSLFRGVAEGMAGGQASYVGFPESFLQLGQGAFLGLPTQLWIVAPAAVAFYLLVHRSTVGRALSAIGYAPDGARHAGLRVGRLTGLTYVVAGFCAGLAGLIYVARFGQAKADAATGYELAAITAVVLGGTSIFGGRASVVGTLLGLLAVAFLENGQALAGFKRELTGILVGVLLLAAVGLDFTRLRGRRPRAAATGGGARAGIGPQGAEELDMRNSQLAALCAVIVAAALIVAGGNLVLVNAIKKELAASARAGGPGPDTGGGGGPAAGRKLVVAMMPKSKGNAYFIACQRGAEEAAKELGVEFLWDGPTSADPAEQNKIVETWVTRKVDVIAVAVENAGGLSTALRKARSAGIKVVTWDADAEPDARDFFCNQATPEGIGSTLMDQAAKAMGEEGKFVVISGSRTAANLNLWLDNIKARAKAYPKVTLAEVVYCDDKQNVALDLGKQMLNKYPDLKAIVANCSPAVPGGAEAVKQSGRANVKVVGLGLPNENKRYVHDGVTEAVVLWKTADLGYLTVHAAKAAAEGRLKSGDKTFAAGRLGAMEIQGSDILLGKPFVFTKENIDQFDF